MDFAIREQRWVAHVEDSAVVVLVSIVSIGAVNTVERRTDAIKQTTGSRRKVQGLKITISSIAEFVQRGS